MLLVVCSLALALSAGYAAAQAAPGPDTLKVDYFSNSNTAGAPDATLRITNPGSYSPEASSKRVVAGGNLCANIFVFDVNQELTECGSCLLTPDGLRTLSVDKDLTSNPLTGVILNTGAIKIVSSPTVSGGCPLPDYAFSPVAGVRAWTTHIQGGSAISETAAQDATLSAAEVRRLQNQCYAIALDGSGSGILSCGTGD
jgi:hypothetical protein